MFRCPFCLTARRDSFETQDGLYDVAWSEIHENQIVSASADGSLKLWDVMVNVSTISLRTAPSVQHSWGRKEF